MSNLIDLSEWLSEKKFSSATNKSLCLSEDQVRSFSEFRDTSPEEISNIITSLHTLALLTYELFVKEVNENEEFRKAA